MHMQSCCNTPSTVYVHHIHNTTPHHPPHIQLSHTTPTTTARGVTTLSVWCHTTNTNPDCMVNGLRTASQGALACGADTICKNVAYQSKCGALTRFANEAGLKWTVYVRRESTSVGVPSITPVTRFIRRPSGRSGEMRYSEMSPPRAKGRFG